MASLVRERFAERHVTNVRLGDVKGWLRAGEAAKAWSSLRDIDDTESGAAELWYLRSLAAQQLGESVDAQASAERAIALDGRHAYFHLQAARVAAQREVHEVAISHFEAAIGRDASLALAWAGLGSACLALGSGERALEALRQAVALGLSSASTLLDLARLAFTAGRLGEAMAAAQRAASTPEAAADALLLIGDIHHRRGEAEAALSAYRASQAANLDDPKAGVAVATMLWEQGRWDEASRAYADMARRQPGSLRAALGAALTLPHIYASHDHLSACRERYAQGLADLAQLSPARLRKPEREFLQDLRWCNFLLAYQGANDVGLQSAFGDLVHAALREVAPGWLALPEATSPRRERIRVGFASHFFYDCTAGRYFSPWVVGLDAQRFEVYVYYTNVHVSPNTRRLQSQAAAFRHLPGAPVQTVAQRIRDDQLDILIYPELGMHPDTFALASLRLAPVQCAAWGHPTTTGLPTIDVFLGCAEMEPEASQPHYRERLVLLPGLGTCYAHPGAPAPATRVDLGLPEGRTLYLIPQSFFKIHPDNDDLIAAVLAGDPNSMAVFFANDARPVVDALVQRLKPTLARYGLSTQKHLLFLPPMRHDAYLAVNHHCDVMLDTLHWSGGNTALDALSVGLPMVTLPGQLMRGRQSSAMLRRAGLDDLIALDREGYVRIAARLGADREWRMAIRQRSLAGRAALFDDPAPLAALNDVLEGLARDIVYAQA